MALKIRPLATAAAIAVAVLLLAMVAVGELARSDSERRQTELAKALLRPLARIGDLYHALTRTRLHEGELLRTAAGGAVVELVERIGADEREVMGLLEGIEQGLPTAGRDELFGIVEQWRRYRVDLDRVTEAALAGDLDQAARYVNFLTGPRFEAIVAQLERLHEDVANRIGVDLQAATDARLRLRWLSLLTALAGMAAVAVGLTVFVGHARARIARLGSAIASLGSTEGYEPAGLRGGDEIAELASLLDASRQRLAEQERQGSGLLRLAEGREVERVRDLRRARADLRRERRACKDLEARHRLLSDALEQCPVDLLLLDIRGDVVHASSGYLQREGKRLAEVVGRRPAMISKDEAHATLFAKMWTMVLSGTRWEGVVDADTGESGRPGGDVLRAIPLRGTDGIVSHALLIRQPVGGEASRP
ncbi:MAG: hypothetical protein KDH15_05245 [Rhodocyclaceae bacterium]|nr:hypothetical protein [Rhodocyclaceae bacterium]